MRDPFSLKDQSDNRAGTSGMIDYWISVDISGGDVTIQNYMGEDTVGVALRVKVDGDVVYRDRHGQMRSELFKAGEIIPTSVSEILQTGTTATGVMVAIAP